MARTKTDVLSAVATASKAVEQTTDIKIFIPEENSVTTITGTVVPIPKLSWKKELKLLEIIQQSIDTLVANQVDPTGEIEHVVTRALRVIPDKITEFMAIVMDHDPTWVEDNLDSPEILGVIVPLLRSRLDLILSRIRKFIPEDAKDPSSLLQSVANSALIQ